MTSNAGGRYQILGHLAQGGMGEILLARRLGPAGFQKLVVLKRPLRHAVGSRALVEALIDEARLLAQINHPNVCQVHDLEEAEHDYYLSLEFLEGLSLWAIVSRLEADGAAIDPRALCGMFEQVCDGLDAIHGLRGRDGAPIGVVHRDISPGNLFVTETGTVKILDLGIAKSSESEERTPFGRVKGKLPYVSPEQVAGKPIDGRADLFALGFVMYDVARGRRPPADRIGALAREAIDLAAVPAPIAEVITRAIEAEPAHRFASAREMAAALRGAGARLGGSYGRAELAEWLARGFHVDLAARRARTEQALAGIEPASATQPLAVRSVITQPPTVSEVRRPAPSAASAMLQVEGLSPSWSPRETEQLVLSDDELVPRRASQRMLAGGGPAELPTGTPGPFDAAQFPDETEVNEVPPEPAVAPRAKSRALRLRLRTIVLIVCAIGAAGVIGVMVAKALRGGPVETVELLSERADRTAPVPPAAAAEAAARDTRFSLDDFEVVPRGEAAAAGEKPAPPKRGPPARDASRTNRKTAAPVPQPQPQPPAPEPVPPLAPVPAPEPPPTGTGIVVIDSDPFAWIYVNGQARDVTPKTYQLPAGRHQFRAVTEDGRTQTFELVVQPGLESKKRLTWER